MGEGQVRFILLPPNRTLVGMRNWPGLAYCVNKNPRLTVDDNILFLLSQNPQRCKGKWFVSALLKFRRIVSFSPELVMGVKSRNNNILLQTPWWFGAINNIRDDKDITQSRGVHPQGVSSYAWIEFSKQALWYLNQISGPSFTCWDVYPSIEIVDGVEYHQCWLGPDQWSNRSKIFKELEANASLTNPQYDTWKKHDDHYIESCDDLIAQLCSSRKLSQFHGSRVCVTYSLLQQAYGKYMWMHMPSSTPCGQYFGLIT